MNAIRADQAVEYSRREASRPVPSGPLAPHQVRDLQSLIVLGLIQQRYTREQIAQIIPIATRTVARRIAQRV